MLTNVNQIHRVTRTLIAQIQLETSPALVKLDISETEKHARVGAFYNNEFFVIA